MAKEFKMSQARYDELKQELDYSKTTRADEVAELIKEARGFGDLSENSEYDEAKNEQGKLYSRIAELEDILLHAVIVDESEMDSDKISIGCTVTVTTVDGSYGKKGFVTDALPESYTHFCCCGPEPMLKAVYRAANTSGQMSFEERMGCGFGACMGCSCKTKYGNKRICKDGPVLEKEEIVW